MTDRYNQRLKEHGEVLDRAGSLAPAIDEAVEKIVACCRDDGGVWLFGNGGSAADAQHIAGELVGRFLIDRPGIRAMALGTDASVVSCVGNDLGFEEVFARQLQAIARRGDVAFALSTSGKSPNVLAALRWARANGLVTIALTGQGGGACSELADVLLAVPSDQTPRIQEVGMVVYHTICELVEEALAGEA